MDFKFTKYIEENIFGKNIEKCNHMEKCTFSRFSNLKWTGCYYCLKYVVDDISNYCMYNGNTVLHFTFCRNYLDRAKHLCEKLEHYYIYLVKNKRFDLIKDLSKYSLIYSINNNINLYNLILTKLNYVSILFKCLDKKNIPYELKLMIAEEMISLEILKIIEKIFCMDCMRKNIVIFRYFKIKNNNSNRYVEDYECPICCGKEKYIRGITGCNTPCDLIINNEEQSQITNKIGPTGPVNFPSYPIPTHPTILRPYYPKKLCMKLYTGPTGD